MEPDKKLAIARLALQRVVAASMDYADEDPVRGLEIAEEAATEALEKIDGS